MVWTTAARRVGASTLSCLLMLLGCLVALPSSSAHAEDSPQIRVTLSTFSPSAVRSGDTVTLTGTVENTSRTPLYETYVAAWRSLDPITTQTGLRQVAASEPYAIAGATLSTKDENIARITPFGDLTTAFMPGEKKSFSLRFQVADLGLARSNAAYLVGVRVFAHQKDAPWAAVGTARTFLPVLGKNSRGAATSLIVLASRPSLGTDGVFLDDHLADDLAGRLRTLLAAAERPGSTYLIDPNLIAEATVMADGYQVRAADGTLSDGTGQQAAALWLDEFEQLDADGYRLPYAMPDLAALVRAGIKQTAERQKAALAGLPDSITNLPLAVLPPRGRLDQAGYDLAATLDPTVMLTSTIRPAGVTATSGSGPSLVSYDPSALGGGPLPEPVINGVKQYQRALAGALLAGGDSFSQIRLITTEADASFDRSTRPSWVRPVTLTTLLSDAGGRAEPFTFTFTSTAEDELSDRHMSGVRDLGQGWVTFQEVAGASDDTAARAAASVNRCSSQLLSGRRVARRLLDADLAAIDLSDPARSIQLEAAARFVMSNRSNEFPVSVANHLDTPATVVLAFTSSHPSRLSVPDYTVTLEPRSTSTVNIRPVASSNGVVTIYGQVRTKQGAAIGRPVQIEVQTTSLGAVAWVVIVVSAVVLVGMTAWRIRQVARRQPTHSEQRATP